MCHIIDLPACCECTMSGSLRLALTNLAVEARELYLSSYVPVIRLNDLTPLAFYRNFVSSNRPVKIVNAIDHWPALHRWNQEYLRNIIGDVDVSVAVTPDGYADAITDGKFMLPDEQLMKFSHFLDKLNQPSKNIGIHYIQKQNSNMTSEFSLLMREVDEHLPWATEAFGSLPDATNFWMGDERAITSLHKDHYENIYCVVRGTKTFTLVPPTDQMFVPYETVPVATYRQQPDGAFTVEPSPDGAMLPWIPVDPLTPDYGGYPQFAGSRPLVVSVSAGELLYLPSLWFHHVQQSHGCIAVNYWYDMQYDIKYNYFQLVAALTKS